MKYSQEVIKLRNQFIGAFLNYLKDFKNDEIKFEESITTYKHEFSDMRGETDVYNYEVEGINKDGDLVCDNDGDEIIIGFDEIEDIVDMARILDILNEHEYYINDEEDDHDN